MAGAVRTLCGMIECGPIIRLGMGYVLVHSRRMLLRDANNHLRTKRLNCLLYTSSCLFYKKLSKGKPMPLYTRGSAEIMMLKVYANCSISKRAKDRI